MQLFTLLTNRRQSFGNRRTRSGAAPENEKDVRFVTYVNDHITDPNLSISLIADHFDMSI